MTPCRPALSRSWFVVAQSRQIGEKPFAVTLLNRPLVIARDRKGGLMALDDCCPHRHVPLSLGRMTDEGLQCAYHGWTFRADGRCVSVPGLMPSTCPPVAQVGAVSVMENDGLVWVRLDGREPAQAETLPAFVTRLQSSARRFVWQSTWHARAVDALENFLDAQHTHFVHAGLVRSGQRRGLVEATISRSQGAVQVDYRGQPAQSGWMYRLFESPREVERAWLCSSAAGTAQLEYRYRNGSALYFTLHFSPTDETQLQVHGTLHVENRLAPTWALRLFVWPFLRRILAQDQAIVEAQAKNKMRFGSGEGLSSELDLVKQVLDATWFDTSSQCDVSTVKLLL
jgi:phenylpropionate dioxygenase-like ring-hydroxylating dioxygenase large terminal subunit